MEAVCSAFSGSGILSLVVVAHRGWKVWWLHVVTAVHSAVTAFGARTFGWCHKCHQLLPCCFPKISVVAQRCQLLWHFSCHVGFHTSAWDDSRSLRNHFRFSADPKKNVCHICRAAITIMGKRHLVNRGWGLGAQLRAPVGFPVDTVSKKGNSLQSQTAGDVLPIAVKHFPYDYDLLWAPVIVFFLPIPLWGHEEFQAGACRRSSSVLWGFLRLHLSGKGGDRSGYTACIDLRDRG